MKKVLYTLITMALTQLALADLASMFQTANNFVANTPGVIGYVHFSRNYTINNGEPQGQHIVAYMTDAGLITEADVFNFGNGSYDFLDTIFLDADMSEEAFRQQYIAPYSTAGGSNGTGSGSTGSGGNGGNGGTGSGGSGWVPPGSGGGGGSFVCDATHSGGETTVTCFLE